VGELGIVVILLMHHLGLNIKDGYRHFKVVLNVIHCSLVEAEVITQLLEVCTLEYMVDQLLEALEQVGLLNIGGRDPLELLTFELQTVVLVGTA